MKIIIYLIFVVFSVQLTAESPGNPQVTIISDLNPPYVYLTKDGVLAGTSVNKIKALFKQAGISYEMKIHPWKRALEEVKKRNNLVIFPLSRIPERENDFIWISLLLTERYQIYGLAGAFNSSEIDITSGDYTFVCPSKTILCIALAQLGVPKQAIINISGVNDRQMINMVLQKRVHFTMIADVGLAHQLKRMEVKSSTLSLMKGRFFEVDEYLAANTNFDVELLKKIRAAEKALSK